MPAWLLSTYRVFAYLTGVLLLTLTIALVALLGTEPKPEWYAISWTLHGWAYMGYLGSGFALSFLMRWSIGRTLLVLLAGTIPAMSFVAERWVIRNVAVRDGGEYAVTSPRGSRRSGRPTAGHGGGDGDGGARVVLGGDVLGVDPLAQGELAHVASRVPLAHDPVETRSRPVGADRQHVVVDVEVDRVGRYTG